MSLDGGALEQLTDIRAAGAGGDTQQARGGAGGGSGIQATVGPQRRASESQEFVRKEERQPIDAVRERAEQREEQQKKRRDQHKRRPLTLTARQTATSLLLSPDGSCV